MARTALIQTPNAQQVSYLPPGQLLYLPDAIPYPTAIRRGWIPNPNAQAVEWPSAQFAPEYLPADDGSIQQFSYFKADHPTVLFGGPYYAGANPYGAPTEGQLADRLSPLSERAGSNRFREFIWGENANKYAQAALVAVLAYLAWKGYQRATR